MLTATGPVSKMVSQQEKAFCVLRFEVSRSVITVQREFRARFKKDAPLKDNVTRWLELPFIFTRMYECFAIVFFHSAGSDLLQMKTTTFSLGHPVRRILNHAISFFGGPFKTAFMCHHCPRPSRNFVIGQRMHCRPLQRTCYIVLDEFDYRVDVCHVTQSEQEL
jgi:hypothetical protein